MGKKMGVPTRPLKSGDAKRGGAKKRPAEEAPAIQAPTFNDVAAAFVNTVYAVLLGLKGRTGGAQDYGADGLFVCAVEALHTARASKNLEDFLKSAAYSAAAAMKAGGAWDHPLAAAPEGPVKKAESEEKNS